MTEADLRHKFHRLRPELLAAILEYHRTADPDLVPGIAKAILHRYALPDEWLGKETIGDDAARHEEEVPGRDLDSLTMLEIILDFEDAFGITFERAELRLVHSTAEMRALLLQKVSAKPEAYSPEMGNRDDGHHRRPFTAS
jgi:acyl carrier protein